MLYVIHVVRRPISILDALGVFFCADRFGVGKVTRKQDGYPVQVSQIDEPNDGPCWRT